MPTAADLKAFASANMPEDDASASGGAIDTATLIEFTPLAANDSLEMVSDNAGDAGNATLTGRQPSGAIASETAALNGTTVVPFSTLGTIERLMKFVLAAAATGSVTLRRAGGGATVAVLAAGITAVRRMFYDSASEASATTRYEKIFLKNTHATETLNNAAVKLTADPSTSIRIGVAGAKDDTGSVANRKTAPGGVTFVDDNVSQSVPTGALAALEAIGVWVELQRGAGAAAIKDSFTVELSGTSV